MDTKLIITEQEQRMSRINLCTKITFVPILLMSILVLSCYIPMIWLRYTDIGSDSLFYWTISWFMLSILTIPIGTVLSIFNLIWFCVWQKSKEHEPKKLVLAIINTVLGLLPLLLIAITFLIFKVFGSD